MDKTIIVAVETKKNHPICGKCMNYSKKYKVHGENDTAKVDGIVRTTETCPLPTIRRSRLSEVVEEAVII